MANYAQPSAELCARIYAVVRQIPAGQVSTYGDVARIVGHGCDARSVGFALAALDARAGEVPWQRVINREGSISTRGTGQRALLEAEGVAFDEQERADMRRFRWAGPAADWAAAHGFQMLPPREHEPEQLRLF